MGFGPTYAMYKLGEVISEVFERIEWIYRAANESISSAIGFRILKTTFTEAEQLSLSFLQALLATDTNLL